MLAQDDFVAPNMSRETPLRRSSWKAEAIRRGDLKISGPFPITDDTPLNEDEEREYAQKHSIEQPPPLPGAPTQQILQPLPQPQASVRGESLHTTSDREEERIQPHEEHPESQPKESSTTILKATNIHTTSTPEPTPNDSPSLFPSVRESTTKWPSKKRQKSGLRNVLRKLFGRRSRSQEPIEERDKSLKHGHTRSDPGVLSRSSERPKENGNGPRISDLPVRELAPLNPLGQHLPFPMNVNAPQQASPPLEYLTFAIPDLPHRRRATLPSVFLANTEARPQAASWDERLDSGQIPSPQIGIALSSPSDPRQSVHSRRRSQSAGALRRLAKSHPSIERRRSAEIEYWRNSYQSGSIYGSNTPRPRTAQTIEGTHVLDTQEATAGVTAESRASHMPEITQHQQHDSEIEVPADTFNFGNLKTKCPDNEEKVVQKLEVPSQPEKRLSIEERVKHLESNLGSLEISVRSISGRSNRQTIILENAPKSRRSRNRSSSATSERQGSRHSSRNSNRTSSAREEELRPSSPGTVPLSAVDEFPSSRDRPLTIVAVEPSAIPKEITWPQQSNVEERFASLYETLQLERGARRALEKQVSTLQREVSELHAIVSKLISASPAYPTPSPDTMTGNEERLSTPRVARRPERGLGFDFEDEGIGSPTSKRIRETIISRFSASDSEGGDISVTSSREDITSPEAWATPKEQTGFGSGIFGPTPLEGQEDGLDEGGMF